MTAVGPDDRARVLGDLVSARKPLEGALGAVQALPRDSDVELVVLRPTDVASVLQRFTRGELSAEDVERWADALEARDDVAVDPGTPGDLLCTLATPGLEGVLTPGRAELFVRDLDEGESI